MKTFSHLHLPCLLLLSGLSCASETIGATEPHVKDVVEGEDVVLECRFSPALEEKEATLYWIRSTTNQHDNVAIGDKPYSTGYTVEHEPELGRYDLRIKNATYDRDNGNFECRKVEYGSGNKLHSSTIKLVVLLPPSPPTVAPVQHKVTEGKEFNITCNSFGGSPPPDVLWYKNDGEETLDALYIPGNDRTQPTSAVLTVIPKKEDDNSTFRCTVWNRAIPENRLMEASTSINVNYYPRVTVGPENPIRVERDDTAELHCKVDSKPAVKEVRWVRDGRFVQTQFRHLIPRANLKDAGSYFCEANNGLGQAGKAEVKLDVLFGPEVSVAEQREVAQGEEVVINCQVSANPGPSSIVWTKEDNPEFKQTGPTLRLAGSNPAAINNGKYTCSATNFIQPTGRQRMKRQGNATISIAVRHAPESSFITPEEPTAFEGKSITLECGSKPPGYPLPTYRWWKEGSENSVLATGAKFTIDKTRLANAGKYYCQPSNDLGTGTRAETLLSVFQAPKIITQLQPTIVKRAGDTGFIVTCSAVGKPEPTVRWFKDGVEIDSSTSDLYQVSLSTQEAIANEAFNVLSTLKFVGPERIASKQLMPTDRGHYTCQFENEVDRTESTMLLRIEHSPVVRHQHNKVAADLGEVAYISCKMQAYPSLKFEWSKGNSLLTANALYSMNTTELKDDIYEGILTIAYVDESSYDEYSCKALNDMGRKKTIIKLQPKGKPEAPRNVRALEKGYDAITLEWDKGFNGGYEETTYNIEYKEIGGGNKKFIDCRWKNPCNITGLAQHTTYQFKVKAVNIRGDSHWSRDIKITTEVDVTKIPQPDNVYYETIKKGVSFNVINYPMDLVAKIELEMPNKSWHTHAQLVMNDLPYGEMPISDPNPVTGLRIKLCLTSNDQLCGPYSSAQIVEVREAHHYKSVGFPMGALIAIAAVLSLISIVAICLVIKCCCCKQEKPKKITKDDIAGPNRAQQNANAFNYGLDNKGVDTAKDTSESPDIIKTQMYGYNYPQVPAAQVPNNLGYQDSTSNSNNGGSVNSQDSLWNVKHPNGEPISANGYISAGGYYGDQQQIHHQQHHQQAQHYPNYDDYTHYPHPEEYMNERNRAYFANGDQYALPNKPRQRLESDYSPYGDVSGLPDPYTGHDISDELRQQVGDGAGSHAGVSLHSHDSDPLGPPPPEGYSTPSRRVIREIIV